MIQKVTLVVNLFAFLIGRVQRKASLLPISWLAHASMRTGVALFPKTSENLLDIDTLPYHLLRVSIVDVHTRTENVDVKYYNS